MYLSNEWETHNNEGFLNPGIKGKKFREMMEIANPKIVYHWAEATVPPPDHYEIEIQLLPSGGSIKFWPDYPGGATPSWESSFTPNDRDLDQLLHIVLALHDTEWLTHSPPRLGGASEWLEIFDEDLIMAIPPDLIQEQAVRISLVYKQIRGLVPPNIWEDFMQCRRSYQQTSGY